MDKKEFPVGEQVEIKTVDFLEVNELLKKGWILKEIINCDSHVEYILGQNLPLVEPTT